MICCLQYRLINCELKGEGDLKESIEEMIGDMGSGFTKSLAQHDKQVKVEVLETLVEQSTFRGLRNSIQPEELDELINQIKELE